MFRGDSLSNWVNCSEMHRNNVRCGMRGAGGMREKTTAVVGLRWSFSVLSGRDFLAAARRARWPIREVRDGLDNEASL